MMCRISLPRMEMWSRLTGLPPLTVIFAVRRLVFICGETEAIEPLMIVPAIQGVSDLARRCLATRGYAGLCTYRS